MKKGDSISHTYIMKNNKSSVEKSNVISRISEIFKNLHINSSKIDLFEIELTKLRENKNSARMSGVCAKTITDMAQIIKDGQYNPYLHIPPVVELNSDDKSYTIVSGHHRFKAHRQAKKSKMTCIVTKFDNQYHRAVWRAFENSAESDSYVKNVSDEKNDVLLIVHNINTKVLPDNRDAIERFIKDAKLARTSNKINNLVNKVLLKIGKVDSDFVKSYDKSDKIVDTLREKYPNRTFVGQTFKGTVDVDYDYRALNKIADSFIENPAKPIDLVYSINDNTKDDVLEIRNYKSTHLIDNYVNRCREVVRLHDEGHSLKNIVSFHHLPQLGKEIEGNDEGLDTFYQTLDKKIAEKPTTKLANTQVCNLLDKVKSCKDMKDVEKTIKQFFTSNVGV